MVRTPSTYFLCALFFSLCEFFLYLGVSRFQGALSSFHAQGVTIENLAPSVHLSVIEPFFQAQLFFLMLFVPLLGMGALSEARRMGTLDWIRTFPVSLWQIMAAKFVSLSIPILLTQALITICSLFVIQHYAPELSVWWFGEGMLVLYGWGFLAITLCFSALCDHQLSAGIGSLTVLFILYFLRPLRDQCNGGACVVLERMSLIDQSQGVFGGYLTPFSLAFPILMATLFLLWGVIALGRATS